MPAYMGKDVPGGGPSNRESLGKLGSHGDVNGEGARQGAKALGVGKLGYGYTKRLGDGEDGAPEERIPGGPFDLRVGGGAVLPNTWHSQTWDIWHPRSASAYDRKNTGKPDGDSQGRWAGGADSAGCGARTEEREPAKAAKPGVQGSTLDELRYRKRARRDRWKGI